MTDHEPLPTGAELAPDLDLEVRQAAAAEALDSIGELLERMREPSYRVRAFRGAADIVRSTAPDVLLDLARTGHLQDLAGVGEKTERVILQAMAGEEPAYLTRLRGTLPEPAVGPGADLRAALRGDLHVHSDWSDGGSPIEVMARKARDMGHEYMALTDHSPRLKVANGLSAERLVRQLEVVESLNRDLAPFRILSGIEVDILDDGSLDQSDELLQRLDVVVASVHSKLRMEERGMTARMVTAVTNPHVDVLGHCTGRMVVGKGRPPSDFDAGEVFAAAAAHGTAIEVNSRPERLDPPRHLLRQAVAAGCLVAIDTDAHAPGQLEWQPFGTDRAAECGVEVTTVVNAWPLEKLLDWTDGGG